MSGESANANVKTAEEFLKKMKKGNQLNHRGCISEKSDTSSRWASGITSGGVLEDIFIIGDVSSMHVTISEDLSMGYGVEVEDSDIDYPYPM